MKKLLFLCFVFASILLNAQNKAKFEKMFAQADSAFTCECGCLLLTVKTQKEFTDTIKVKALVSYDYAYSDKYSELKVEPVFVTYLLQIRKHCNPYHSDYYTANEQQEIKVVGYLGEHGEPLSKIINVWQTKPIKR